MIKIEKLAEMSDEELDLEHQTQLEWEAQYQEWRARRAAELEADKKEGD